MQIHTNHSLKKLNTFQVDSHADQYIRFDTEDEILDYIQNHFHTENRHLVMGGGSNLLFVNHFNGTILHPVLQGIEVIKETGDDVHLKAMAGETWDDLVAFAVDRGWGGIENLSLIPGSVGASAVQNIGAYGVEVKSVIESIEAVSIQERKKVTILPKNCGFAYRFSHFKDKWKNKYIITSLVYKLLKKPEFVIHYPGVKETVEKIGPVNLENLRKAIIKIREIKLPDPIEIGNAGSFFKNPIVTESELKQLLKSFPDLPHYRQSKTRFKLAAGWMIEYCGWKGKSFRQAAVHDNQALVIINLGKATGREIYELSERIELSIYDTFGIELHPEVLIVK